MSYSVSYLTLPTLTINDIGYTFSANILIGNASWTNSGPVTLPSGVWLCTMNALTSSGSGSLGSNQGSDISISTIVNSINSQHVATCGAVGGNQGSNTACSLTAVFTNPPTLYFNLYSGPPASAAYCNYSYTRLA